MHPQSRTSVPATGTDLAADLAATGFSDRAIRARLRASDQEPPGGRSIAPMPAAIARNRAKRQEWADLEAGDRAILTDVVLARWVGDLAPDDYTLAEVAVRERRRLANFKSFRQGAELTDLEWRLWRYLGRHEGRVCTKLEIARHLWQAPDRPIRPWMLRKNPENGNASPLVAALQNLISDIRSKLEIDPLRPQHLATVRAVGYVWYDAPPSSDDGVDYAARHVRYSRLREQVLEQVYGQALPSPEGEALEEPYVEGEVVDAVSYDHVNEEYRPRVQPGPELLRREAERDARRARIPGRPGTTPWWGDGEAAEDGAEGEDEP